MNTDYVVTINQPFQFDIAYCETLEEAEAQAKEWLDELPDYVHERPLFFVSIAKVVRTTLVGKVC